DSIYGVGGAMRWFTLLFFFQAEDGIRDFHVTGVQTCALPISRRVPQMGTEIDGPPELTPEDERRPNLKKDNLMELANKAYDRQRSEERRVGKEWRCRSWPHRYRKQRERASDEGQRHRKNKHS